MIVFNKIKKIKASINEKKNYINEDSSHAWMSPDSRFKLENESKIKDLESKMIYYNDTTIHPDKLIKKINSCIQSYYELKEFCQKSEDGKIYFSEMWQHCSNSKYEDFDFIENLEKLKEDLIDNYDCHLKQYKKDIEILNKVSNENVLEVTDLEKKSMYINKEKNYISKTGKECVKYEQSLYSGSSYYINNTCPYCHSKITMPKMKKNCPVCKNKIYVRDSGIQLGKIAITEEQYLKLKRLKDLFYDEIRIHPKYK